MITRSARGVVVCAGLVYTSRLGTESRCVQKGWSLSTLQDNSKPASGTLLCNTMSLYFAYRNRR